MIDVGQHIRDYEVVARLKPGGMATLFLARRTGPRGFTRPVVIKIVHPHLAGDPELVQMFLDEARLSACIQHPNVVHIEELGEAEGAYFLAMEYLPGESLSSLLAALSRVERPLGPRVAMWVARCAAAGLHAAHETRDAEGIGLGIVHRDVSPQNLLVSIDGHVKLIDFGIAKSRTVSTHTEAGAVKGKLAYMSPEQVRGEPVDRRTDVYALGIVLWEMLTMRRLFAGTELELLDAVRDPRIPPPSSVVSGIPHAFDDVVLQALSREATDRFATAEEMELAIAQVAPEASGVAPELARAVRDALGDRIEARRRELAAAPDPERTAVTRAETETRSGKPTVPSLGVMPFRTMAGPDPDFGDGLADELRDVLSRVRGLRVKARIAPREAEDAGVFGERIGVGFVVTGRVLAGADGRFRLSAAVTSVEDGFQIWSSKLDCGMNEALDATDRLARGITEALGTTPSPSERGPQDDATVALALALRKATAQFVIEDPALVLSLHTRILREAPRDPSMLAASAIALVRSSYWPHPPENALRLARDAAEQALDLAPSLPEPWLALGNVRLANGDPSGVVRALRRAITHGPSVYEAYDLVARVLTDCDRLDEAMRHAEHAIWLHPDAHFARSEKIRIHLLRGEWDEAAPALDRLTIARHPLAITVAARASLWSGRMFPRPDFGSGGRMGALGEAIWRRLESPEDERDDVEALLAGWLSASAPRGRAFVHQIAAEIHAAARNHEKAVASTALAIDAGLEDLAWFDRCPLLRDVRQHPSLAARAAILRDRAEAVRRAWDEW